MTAPSVRAEHLQDGARGAGPRQGLNALPNNLYEAVRATEQSEVVPQGTGATTSSSAS